ncbi:hypothetical protein C7H19_23780 [Aphanothece hegewaldii CCALA 016]|uniref:Uncharacterized protein n=1 Tax=Aphanothece hegewaldii CCALA 016 TaxID=2107694 RepID=A0A2T1LR46_9CHRO|nr:hypothetical protein [Aphanothece hegewaldii]PSF30535.1 hypothetical protein C7H19_23780 [Aphanothece hegewaldii CCALA 016]
MNNKTITIRPTILEPGPDMVPIKIQNFPTLGTPRFYERRYHNFWNLIVLPIGDHLFEFEYKAAYDGDLPDPKNSQIIFNKTKKPETKCIRRKEQIYQLPSPYKSYPIWAYCTYPIQNDLILCPKDEILYPLACFWTLWGDDGNENLYSTLDKNGLPTKVYIEFSCH